MSDHTATISGLVLACRCGRLFPQHGAAKFRTLRRHLSVMRQQAREAEHARQVAPWHEMVREVTADRLSILPCSLIAFAWACEISRPTARRWLVRHDAAAIGCAVAGRARVWSV